MAVVYNSNQIKYGGRGYLDAKIQPVANLAALEALDSLELIEGMTIVVLNDGSGQPHDYWYIGGQWVKKDNGGDIIRLEQEIDEISGNVETIETTITNKVDKEPGKGLSTNDFTNELKSKLNGVEEGAEKNVKANWAETDPDSDGFIQNKPDLSNFVTKDTDELVNYYKKSEVYTKEEVRAGLDETLDAAEDYTDEVISGVTDGVLASAKSYTDASVADFSEAIEAESQRAQSVETLILHSLTAETQARENRDLGLTASAETLSQGISDEIQRAQSAESALTNSISVESNRAHDAESALLTEIENEVERANLAESVLSDGLSDVQAKLDGLDNTTVKDYVDESISSAVSSVYRVKGSVEFYIDLPSGATQGDVYNVETPTVIGEKSYPAGANWVWVDGEPTGHWDPLGGIIDISAIDEERDRAISAETALAKDVSNLTHYVDEQIADTRQGAFIAATAWTVSQGYAYEEDVVDTAVDLLNRISASTSATTELINQEKSRAEQAEVDLLEAVNAEQARAISAETEIENSIQAVVDAESERAQDVESDLLDAINAEKARAQETESGLRQMIDDEAERAVLGESILEDAIERETSRATNAETQLSGKVVELSAHTDSEIERLEGEILATTPVLTQSLTASISVGGVSAGTVFSAGTSIESILIMLFGNGSTGEPTTQKYAYYGSVDDSERMYEENPLPEEEFNEQNIKARLTKSPSQITVSDEFEFTVNAGDTQIVVAIPATLAIKTATDVDNNINYTGAQDGIVNVTIDSNPYKAYYYDSDSGFGQFKMKITLKNA